MGRTYLAVVPKLDPRAESVYWKSCLAACTCNLFLKFSRSERETLRKSKVLAQLKLFGQFCPPSSSGHSHWNACIRRAGGAAS